MSPEPIVNAVQKARRVPAVVVRERDDIACTEWQRLIPRSGKTWFIPKMNDIIRTGKSFDNRYESIVRILIHNDQLIILTILCLEGS
jgi:hypothetical protein